MANYELSNIAWKGNTYTVKDNSALHQSAIGSWTPDFANLKPLATYEYDISSTSYFKICERPNVTSIKDIADEVLAFRITVTGTNIFSIADVIVRAQPTVGQRPLVTANYQTQSTSASTTGIRYLRTVTPKAANTSYKYEIAIGAYNTTKRHIKVEVFKTTSDWTFSSAATVYSYNSTYQTISDMPLYTNIGLIYGYTWYGTASYANYAGYKSTWDGLFCSGPGNFLNAGAAIAANQFVFIGKDNKFYPTTSTSVEIDPAWPIVYCTTAHAANDAVQWSAIRMWGHVSPASSILKDGTLAVDGTVYMRCTYTNGKLYSANTMTQNLTAGNTYIKLGKMSSATAVSVNTYNSEYFTFDSDGHIKALNGYLFNAAKADTASTVSKGGSTAAGTYGILFDNNPITSVVPTNTSPRVNVNLTFDPSTGNLTSGIFTGSGAGLTGVPLSSIRSDEPDEDTDVFLSRTATNGDKKYKSAKLVGGTVAFNQIFVAPSNRTGYGITITRDSEKKTTTVSGTATRVYNVPFDESPLSIVDHVYYASLGNADIPNNTIILYNDNAGVNTSDGSNGDTIGKATRANKFYYRFDATASFSSPVTLTPQIIDLTLMFGSTIANRIYALETATAGAGVAWFKKHFPKEYYPYDTGTLVSVCPTGMASSNNIWNNDNYQLLPRSGITKIGATSLIVDQVAYQENYNTYPIAQTSNPIKLEFDYKVTRSSNSSAQFFVYIYSGSTSKSARILCPYVGYQGHISLVSNSDPSSILFRSWSYSGTVEITNIFVHEADEQKKDASYIISPLELNGYPSLDSNDNLVYDGDIRESNGVVTRKYAKIELKSFTGAWGATSNGYGVYYVNYALKRSSRSICPGFTYSNRAYSDMPVMTWCGGSGASETFSFILPSTVTSLAEANTWLASNPITFIAQTSSEPVESTYPFKSPQLVYSGETESFIDDRDVPMPVGQIAEYMDSFDAVEDAALADTGNCELLSNKVTSVDSSSTDDQYPSAKAVYDAIPSKIDMATMAYTASAIDFTTGAVTIPIDGTEYKLLQLTVFNNDISKVLGKPSLFLFNASGTTGYKEGTTTYCITSSTSSNITVTFDSSWGIIGSTSVDITALYRRIS